MAEAITELSIRNYGLTASMARVLGVDPDLAAAAVQASDSSLGKALVPFSVRRAGVLRALQTGLFSLKWLQDWQSNVLGGVRVRALQHLIDTGKSLPLIFPEQDLGTVYTKGALVPESRNRVRPSSRGAAFKGVQLQAGGRIPHCWMTPRTKKVAESSNDELNPARYLDFTFSTVNLPSLMENLAAALRPSNKRRVFAGPTLIVHAKHEAAAVEAAREINSSSSMEIAVVTVHDALKPLAVRTLQATHQNPRYSLTPTGSSDRPEVLDDQLNVAHRFAPVYAGEVEVGYAAVDPLVPVLPLEDAEGRWRECCATYALGRGEGQPVSAEDVAVVLRPDGHVASVIHVGDYNLFNPVQEATAALCMLRAGGSKN